jgi:fumarate hydratase class II
MKVPTHAYYGPQTARAVDNFPISGETMGRSFLRAMGLIKGAAARVNRELGLLDPTLAEAIAAAAGEVAAGTLDTHFPVDVFQTGSGTSTNMNANEVIARRATELLNQRQPGAAHKVHPNDHVNIGQSSNDVIPTAIHLSVLLALRDDFRPALTELQRALEDKAAAFLPIVKTGRTHLQDATPIRLGQEFRGYAGQVARALRRAAYGEKELAEVPLGGTAVGTGTNAHPQFSQKVCALLSAETGLTLVETDNHFQAQASLDAVVFAASALKTYATALMKVANDVRWMGSGPRAGLGELNLPAVQPGSSIMPGKVNPVICESTLMVCAQVLGEELVVSTGNAWGNFELNTMMPLMARATLRATELLSAASRNFARACIQGLEATPRGPALVEAGLMLATALAPVVGYDRAAEIAKEAAKSGQTIREVARIKTQLSEAELTALLDASRMTEPGFTGGGGGG